MTTATQSIITEPRFMTLEEIQAAATILPNSGYIARQDFDSVIGDYRRKETVVWQTVQKVPAAAPRVQEQSRASYPAVGFVPRDNLANPPSGPRPLMAQTDPGQEVKAVAGIIDIGHFATSMVVQQGNAYGDQLAEDTEDLVKSCLQLLDRKLIDGDAATNPLEFNGLINLTPNDHVFAADITGTSPDLIRRKLVEVVARASSSQTVMRNITHIFCSLSGSTALENELEQTRMYYNTEEVVPGIQVPAINTHKGRLPIVASPFVTDVDGGAGSDRLLFHLVDMNLFKWHGVYPFGGAKTFEPQVFDVSNIVNNQPLLQKRMVLVYGTTHAKNLGQGIYRLEVTAPAGSVFDV